MKDNESRNTTRNEGYQGKRQTGRKPEPFTKNNDNRKPAHDYGSNSRKQTGRKPESFTNDGDSRKPARDHDYHGKNQTGRKPEQFTKTGDGSKPRRDFEYQNKKQTGRKPEQSANDSDSRKPSRNFEYQNKSQTGRRPEQSANDNDSRKTSRNFEYQNKGQTGRRPEQSASNSDNRRPTRNFEYQGKRQPGRKPDQLTNESDNRRPARDFEYQSKKPAYRKPDSFANDGDNRKTARDYEYNNKKQPRLQDARTAETAEQDENEALQLEGRNAVQEAVRHARSIDRILVKAGEREGSIRTIVAQARASGYVVAEVPKEKLDSLSKTGAHQGIIALCPAHEYAEISDMLANAAERGEEPFIIILDGIADPHNLGAVIRTAEAAGAHGVIIPKHRAVGVTAVAAKAAAGAAEYMPVARVTNLNNAFDELKKAGLWVCGAAMDGQSLYAAPMAGPIALVIGGEGGGLGRLVSESCDFTVSVPMRGKIPSLNASVAAAVLMYEVRRRRDLL